MHRPHTRVHRNAAKLRIRRAVHGLQRLAITIPVVVLITAGVLTYVFVEEFFFLLNAIALMGKGLIAKVSWFFKAATYRVVLGRIWVFLMARTPAVLKHVIQRSVIVTIAYLLGVKRRARIRRWQQRMKARVRVAASRIQRRIPWFSRERQWMTGRVILTVAIVVAASVVLGVVALYWFGGWALLSRMGGVVGTSLSRGARTVSLIVRNFPGFQIVSRVVVKLFSNTLFKIALFTGLAWVATQVATRIPATVAVMQRYVRYRLHRTGIRAGRATRRGIKRVVVLRDTREMNIAAEDA